jgi:hypothetical protein
MGLRYDPCSFFGVADLKRLASLLGGTILLVSAVALLVRHAPSNAMPASMAGGAPPLMLWAWEEPEDLRTMNPQTTGVAFLAGRLWLAQDATLVPRHQPIAVAPGAWAEAVIRLEATRAFSDTPKLRAEAATAILHVAGLKAIGGIQVDFDAAASQQAFYAEVLSRVRAGLPQGMTLSITALVSWCAQSDSWLHRLPAHTIDAAVPMYFRLGQHAGRWPVREPLCAASVGASMDEMATAPRPLSGQRLYLFAPRPWTPTTIALAQGERR